MLLTNAQRTKEFNAHRVVITYKINNIICDGSECWAVKVQDIHKICVVEMWIYKMDVWLYKIRQDQKIITSG